MYAITFDLDTAKLQETYGNPSWQNAYTDIKQFLEKGGVHGNKEVYTSATRRR